jgi:hypothetical protein
MLSVAVYILLWLGAGILAAWPLRRRLSPRKWKQAAIVIAYFVLLGVFGHIYFYLYAVDHTRFAFAAEILSTRRDDILSSKRLNVERAHKLMDAVNQLLDSLSDRRTRVHVSPVDKDFVDFKTASYTYEFAFDPAWSALRNGRATRAARLVIRDKGGSRLGSEQVFVTGPDLSLQRLLPRKEWESTVNDYFPPKTLDKFQEMVIPLRARVAASLDELKSDVGRSVDTKGEYWTYLDFLYFSTITQATVGYGDILPNSSIVRLWVVLQVLLGLMLIAIVVNWVASGN